ncbi:hypothetical protein V8C40DRAFT_252040 [Trichoderma camerunense]
MIQPQLEDKSPLKPSFFNVTGDKIEEHLHDSYWQKNLETPVFFQVSRCPHRRVLRYHCVPRGRSS